MKIKTSTQALKEYDLLDNIEKVFIKYNIKNPLIYGRFTKEYIECKFSLYNLPKEPNPRAYVQVILEIYPLTKNLKTFVLGFNSVALIQGHQDFKYLIEELQKFEFLN